MNKFNKIPTSFKCGGITTTVVQKDYLDEGETSGMYHHSKSMISIANISMAQVVNPEKKLRTFYHELAHNILCQYGTIHLWSDETFIELAATYLVDYYLNLSKADCDMMLLGIPLERLALMYEPIRVDKGDHAVIIRNLLELYKYDRDDKEFIISAFSRGLLEFEETAIYKEEE